MRRSLTAIVSMIGLVTGVGQVYAADLEWEVESPFRFYKVGSSFALHEKAFSAVRGDAEGPVPADIVLRTERRLNDPDCKDRTTPASCGNTAGRGYEQSRLGWAAKTHATLCYDSERRPRGYMPQCERRYSWGAAKEDFVLPEAHTVTVRLGAEHVQAAGNGKCVWVWQGHGPGAKSETRTLPCNEKLTIPRVPYSLDRSRSGVTATVKLPDGRGFADPNVTVEDLLIVGLGDSFASGESNPDRPVTFSANRRMTYDPVATREDYIATRSLKPKAGEEQQEPAYGLASGDSPFDPKTLPRRLLEDEEKGIQYRLASREFAEAFERRNAHWVSADCHRSQYGYPFRVAMQLALENRHRAVTLVHLACSGAEVTAGLFLEKDAREQFSKPNSKMSPAQFDQLSDLICRGGSAARSKTVSYTLPMYSSGSTNITPRSVAMRWCPPEQRKRPIDVVLLSIGGNDVGFSALAYYTISEAASDVAPIAALIGSSIRFGANVTRVYLGVLDQRIKAVKDALNDGFGVAPSQVIQTSYEPLQYDETGALCGMRPTLGVDVHPKLRISRERIQEASTFQGELLAKLECMSDSSRRRDCPSGLATGRGTGFKLVIEHLAKFAKRGVCARDPQRAQLDGTMMAMPRQGPGGGEFEPYNPANALPYGHRWRLFHTPNDAFLTANTHREGVQLFDIMQPAYAALYSGALHPTAEGHAMVADSVLPHVRSVINATHTPPAVASGRN
ncbi:MAG: hypothetical protein ACJ8DY_16865 [Xanthobacteraceae bacterium]